MRPTAESLNDLFTRFYVFHLSRDKSQKFRELQHAVTCKHMTLPVTCNHMALPTNMWRCLQTQDFVSETT